MSSWKDNVHFVLVAPREAGNIGSSARAIKNMGFKRLSLVNPQNYPAPEAGWMAANSTDILEKAQIFDTLDEAIHDKSLVVAVSRRTGKQRGRGMPIEKAAQKIASIASENKVAILFGREDRGLHNSETGKCAFIVKIPTDTAMPSLNLAQAVLIMAYELSKGQYEPDKRIIATHEEIENVLTRAQGILKRLRYSPRGDKDLETAVISNLRHICGRAGLGDWEARMLHGLLSEVEEIIEKVESMETLKR